MKTQCLAAAFAVAAALAPGLAAAMCAGQQHVSASSCQPGQAWDAASERCVTPVSG